MTSRLLLVLPLIVFAFTLCGSLARAQISGTTKASPVITDLADIAQRYAADRSLLARRHLAAFSEEGRRARIKLATDLLGAMDGMTDADLSPEARTDRLLLRNRGSSDFAAESIASKREAEIAPLLGELVATVVRMEEDRRRFAFSEPRETARRLDDLGKKVKRLRASLNQGSFDRYDAVRGRRAAGALRETGRIVRDYCAFRNDYDPAFGWWTKLPHQTLVSELAGYARELESRLVSARSEGDATLVGEAAGADGLRMALAHAFIPYSPKELIEIAKQEFAWCDAEMDRAAKEMGFDDWRKAQDEVKSRHVEPGKQIELIRDLAWEAIEFLEKRDLVTVPALCRDGWRMSMLSPEAQRVSPYFLGGEVIQVSYPTHDMTHDEKLMSMRGNNPHFSRATVQHELIPGHHLQGFMTERYRPYRSLFRTPFWIEGWALYWEMRLWDLGFPRGPEDRIGMLFWRKHRCARIIFSLGFHSGTMTARECVDFLVERVGHEPAAAEAEVRRSINGSYPPLYQAAYMLGGLQIRALHRELVVEGDWSERRFHDEILQRGAIPIEVLRSELRGEGLRADHRPIWRFYD